MKTFGELLREFRLGKRMTQQELADRLGLSSPYIAQMESGFKPPPPQALVEKLTTILHLEPDDKQNFIDAAEKERELQSLVKATRKIGYLLAGNKVCVPEKAVIYRLQNELDKIIKLIPSTASFSLDSIQSKRKLTEKEVRSIQTPKDLQMWALSQLGDTPAVALAFLGFLYEVLLLTPDERLLCRQPTEKRKELLSLSQDVGTFFLKLKSFMDQAKTASDEQRLPDVIAPHEVWRNIDDMLSSNATGEPIEVITPQRRENGSIRHVQVIGEIETGSDEFEVRTGLGMVGLPNDWFHEHHEYEAFYVKTDAYISLGIWPGCKAVYELDCHYENDDLVVVQLGDRRCVRKYLDMGDQIYLQGGPLSKPIRVSKTEPSVRILGVIRELISRFRELK